MRILRTHGPIKTQLTSYSMESFLGSAGNVGGVPKGNSLGQMLEMFQKSNIIPWLQIEYHMSPSEWLAFMEYMAAPFDPKTDSL